MSAAEPPATPDARRAFEDLVAAEGRLRDAIVGLDPRDVAAVRGWASGLRDLASQLEAHGLDADAPDPLGSRYGNPVGGRSHGLVPGYDVLEEGPDFLLASAVLRPRFDGDGAVHGGSLALLFDDVLGRLANAGASGPARTAFLDVQFRQTVQWGRALELEGRLVHVAGRKRVVRACLREAGTLLAEAEGLWIELRPEQAAQVGNRGGHEH